MWQEVIGAPDKQPSQDIETDIEAVQGTTADSHNHPNAVEEEVDSDDEWNEVIDSDPVHNLDTVLQDVDFNKSVSYAPGEGNIPLSIFIDKDAEYLSFPTIYCGQTIPDNENREVPVHYSTLCKWELRCQDRRVATCVPNIFFKLKKLQMKQLKDKVALAVRK